MHDACSAKRILAIVLGAISATIDYFTVSMVADRHILAAYHI